MDNLAEQAEELLALEATLDPKDVSVSDNRKEVAIRVELNRDGRQLLVGVTDAKALSNRDQVVTIAHLPPLRLNLTLPDTYPESMPPSIKLDCFWLRPSDLALLEQHLLDTWKDLVGEAVIFRWYHELQETGLSLIHAEEQLSVESETILRDLEEYNRPGQSGAFQRGSHLCLICFCDLGGADFEVVSPECRHFYCRDCLSHYCESRIRDGQANNMACPDPGCRIKLAPSTVKRVVSGEAYETYDRALLGLAVRSMSNTVWCPRLSCQHPAQVMDADLFLGQCPACDMAFCTRCEKTYHGATECAIEQEEKEEKADPTAADPDDGATGDVREYLELLEKSGRMAAKKQVDYTISCIFGHLGDNAAWELKMKYMTDEARRKEYDEYYGRALMQYFVSGQFAQFERDLIDESVEDASRMSPGISCRGDQMKPCPGCYVLIEKDGGCDHMHCKLCGTHFCWGCLQSGGCGCN